LKERDGYSLFYENFYSSPKLFIELKRHEFDAVGTFLEDGLQNENSIKSKI